MKRIVYLLILVLLPCGGITIAGNAAANAHYRKSDWGSLSSVMEKTGRGMKGPGSGGIHIDDPQ